MANTQTQSRNELYNTAPDNIKELYSGEQAGEILWSAANKAGITDKQSYKTFALVVGDVILGLYKPESLGIILKDKLNLPDDKLALINQELKPLLSDIPNNQPDINNTVLKPINSPQTANELKEPKTTPPLEKPEVPEPLPPSGEPSFIKKVDAPIAEPAIIEKPAPAETPHSNVKPLRTFAQDVELSRAHSYGAFRSNTPEATDEDEPVHRSSQDDIIKK